MDEECTQSKGLNLDNKWEHKILPVAAHGGRRRGRGRCMETDVPMPGMGKETQGQGHGRQSALEPVATHGGRRGDDGGVAYAEVVERGRRGWDWCRRRVG